MGLQRFCAHPGCPTKVARGRCLVHERAYDQQRGTAHQRLYTTRWRTASKRWLAKAGRQLCVYCQAEGRVTAAECVDHEPAHRGDAKQFWDKRTWRPSCLACNTRKAIRQEGGFGRPRAR